MNIQSLSPADAHARDRKVGQFLERLVQNGTTIVPNDLGIAGDELQHLMRNVRDAKNLQKIMEKFKLNAENLIEDNYKDGECLCVNVCVWRWMTNRRVDEICFTS